TKGLSGKKLAENRYAVDMTPVNEKLPRVLSNGKRYYLRWVDYENETKKKIKTPQIYKDKIKEFIGSEDYEKFKPSYDLGYFYIDDNDEIRAIDLSLDYYVVETTYTLSGDEASGIKFTKNRYINVAGDNYFYFIDNKFQKINK
ncbi:MAG: tRNA 2-selenouridine synthase, partial [Campylobacter concisus]|nr:tRNA 2-selenouridine synthase [Campylobacter concisus]